MSGCGFDEGSSQVLAYHPGQFEHADLRLGEDGQQLGVGIDGAFVPGVLQTLKVSARPGPANRTTTPFPDPLEHLSETLQLNLRFLQATI